ncbi:hypothetical protein EGM_08845, partial [Macaca fascicularis]
KEGKHSVGKKLRISKTKCQKDNTFMVNLLNIKDKSKDEKPG